MAKQNIKAVIDSKTFELRGVEVSKALSEETTAFSADIYIDGHRAGHVRNNGQGEGNFPVILPEARASYDAIEAAVKRHHYHAVGQRGHVYDWDYDMDFLIGMMVEAAWYDNKGTYVL